MELSTLPRASHTQVGTMREGMHLACCAVFMSDGLPCLAWLLQPTTLRCSTMALPLPVWKRLRQPDHAKKEM